jgi:hypothetical protein
MVVWQGGPKCRVESSGPEPLGSRDLRTMPTGKQIKLANPGRDCKDKRGIRQFRVEVDWMQFERTRCPLGIVRE